MTIRMTLLALALGLLGAGCTGTIHARADASYYGPDMVEIRPGVWVVEDHPYAVFYNDGYYWRYYGGVWYRSSYYDRGFARVHVRYVPNRVRVIDTPRRYVRYRYRGDGNVRVRRSPASRVHRSRVRHDRRDRVRDYRRERREDRRDYRRERREDRRDRARERRDDRRDRVRDYRRDRRHH